MEASADPKEKATASASRLVTASTMERWWGKRPEGAIEDDACMLGAAMFRLSNDEPFLATGEPDAETHIISVHLGGALENDFATDGRRHFRGAHRPGDVLLVPAGQRAVATPHKAIGAEFIHLYVPDQLVRRVTREAPGGAPNFEIKDYFAREDSEAQRAAQIVRNEMLAPGFASGLLLDSVALALAVRLVRKWSNLAEAASPIEVRGGLSAWQVRKAQAMIQDQLAEEVRLEDLADAVGLSVFHFARAFKQSTGVPPHRYQTLARLARARELLQRGNLGVLHVALAVGYESGQAFARAFRREFGCSPADFRRQVER